jgi:hypothetical protein
VENNSAHQSLHIAQYAKDHPDFITVTCLEWKPVLQDDRFKEIIISSLSFLGLPKCNTLIRSVKIIALSVLIDTT